ncbi:hypothetical protein FHS43_003152 [Streptosporangium becharense]|uniref:Uncharacterized protein n=1 Tax=Streptosporangium becharense TaxID=1816182 RepID=A0A7W9ICX6_9ACTN|nr:hypothetical protein [Streptosporangium becharense]MBB2911872.1 hypothetical protein [Streptosporangium becharense]MBB5818419.1 hypothetical protein [Streptosporangium becharense]
MTRRLPRRALALCAGGLLLLSSHPSVAHADPVSPPVAEAWQAPASAGLSKDGSLSDVAAVSATSIWAVGQQSVWDVWQSRGAITHWDGSSWNEVGIRNDPTGAGSLRSIAAASADELWAVGEGHDGLPYLARGDGASFDRVVLDRLHVGDWLGGVAAVSGRVTAVGRRDGQPLMVTGADGKWKLTHLPDRGTLYGVSLSGKSEGWAVGDADGKPLIMRQSDGRWKPFKTPDIPGGYLRDVHIDGPRRALAVGGVHQSGGEVVPLVLSWNGRKWSRVTPPPGDVRLYGVTGDRKGHFWISGVDLGQPGEAFLARYDGRTVEPLRGPEADTSRTVRLQSVAYLPGTGTVWAVGHVVDASGRYTDVIERFGVPKP